MTRVVVTGVGAITPAGTGPDALWRQAVTGRSLVQQIDRFDASPYRCQIAGQADAFVATDWLHGRFVKKTDRFTHLATAAATAAIDDAGLRIGGADGVAPERVGVTVGNVLGGWEFAERGLRDLWVKGPRDVSPYQATAWFPAAPQGNICITLGIKGRARTFVCDRASGAYAIVHAADMIRRGHADVVVAGGSEQPLSPYAWACCETGGFLTPHGNKQPETAYRPFDRGHTGTAIGEGSAFLVLESAGHAESRAATIHGELAGWATNTDGYAPTYTIEPHGETLSRAITQSLRRAGTDAAGLGCVFADGAGVPREDAAEVAAVRRVLGRHLDDTPVTAVKPATGHLMGAAAVTDVVVALRTLSDGVIPPVPNLDRPAPGFDLDFVTGAARDLRGPRTVAVVSRGMGGVNACLVLKHWQP
ncbi:ketosynthase chain-length factor [Virgisporangium ochraceum]|uniref:Putative polyketide beta-ketoacyl synthase 2 n=1 Tax=Virgisporangium ochraceum TaxID=65505 RepID=A0A8J4EDG9_9ACTN|nr:beta-ketoacyl-[acyl-carrier-protein] synthase family protein [Virgisporangium ochraceum]GIJ70689.1 putative polyketide beta-ketoacyl synthase 2 [Virgisporangium ochraceum]